MITGEIDKAHTKFAKAYTHHRAMAKGRAHAHEACRMMTGALALTVACRPVF